MDHDADGQTRISILNVMPVTQRANGGMATAPHRAAAESAARVLGEGGTAIEAALAMAATLCVVYPHMTGLGGDSFWLIAVPGEPPLTINGAGSAGAAVTPLAYERLGLESVPWRGPLAASTVAGAVSAWDAAAKINAGWGGRLPLSRLFADAARLGVEGTRVTAGHAGFAAEFRDELAAQPGFADLHFVGGMPPRQGQLLRQPALARTLESLARNGLDSFYRGRLAAQIAAELAAARVPLTREDLAAQFATLGGALSVKLPMAEVFNCGAPTQGVASLMILGTFAHLDVAQPDGFDHVHGLVESTKRAFAVRDGEVGHPRVDAPSLARHLSVQALATEAARIDRQRAAEWPSSPSGGDTAWFGVIDAHGRAVSAIQSLYFEFGSGVALPESGFVWQNRGSAFQLAGGGPNVLGPGRQPRHTLNPACARFHDGRTLVYGTQGGDGQPQTQAAVFTRYGFFGQDLQDAVSAPRWVLGRTWRDDASSLRVESRIPDHVTTALAAAGHRVERVAALDPLMGHAGAVVHHPGRVGGGRFEGASDPRSDGAALGHQQEKI
jgi:gamma-glutamyltranspeptidase/glutathione hydrolase